MDNQEELKKADDTPKRKSPKCGNRLGSQSSKKRTIIMSGEASPSATLKYLIKQIRLCNRRIKRVSEKVQLFLEDSYQPIKTAAKVTPVTLLCQNDDMDGSNKTADTITNETAHTIEYMVNSELLQNTFAKELCIQNVTMQTVPELLAELNSDNYSINRRYNQGYLVAVVFPENIGVTKLSRDRRVWPMALIQVPTESIDWKWDIRTVNPQKCYFSLGCKVPSDLVGISIEKLLHDFIQWNKFKSLDPLPDTDEKRIDATIRRVLSRTRISPMMSLTSVSDTVGGLDYKNYVLSEGSKSYSVSIPSSRVLSKCTAVENTTDTK